VHGILAPAGTPPGRCGEGTVKITDVKATWLRYAIPEDKQHVSDFGRLTTFDMTLVEVETDVGITGCGEAKAQRGPTKCIQC
jgi:L-alanine-DL-glutamate epimerase-like enolase superfamily enzyme